MMTNDIYPPAEALSTAGENACAPSYFRSVSFYKHLILSVVLALIILPTVMFGVSVYKNSLLKRNYHQLETELVQVKGELSKQLEVNRENAKALIDIASENTKYVWMNAADQSGSAPDTVQSLIPFEVNTASWKYMLINNSHPLSDNFKPQLVPSTNGLLIDYRIKDDLDALLDAGKADGMKLVVCSAYRDYEKQDQLFQESIDKLTGIGMEYYEAYTKTRYRCAPVGYSEHHTGLSVDIVGRSHQLLDAEQADTAEARWMEANCAKYGFIVRYPRYGKALTGMDYESWHFRYVGKEAAAYITENKLTLEEFLCLANKANKTG